MRKEIAALGVGLLVMVACSPAQFWWRGEKEPLKIQSPVERSWVDADVPVAMPPQKKSFFRESFVLPLNQYPYNHGSSLVDLTSGEILITWFAGSKETGNDVQIYAVKYSLEKAFYPVRSQTPGASADPTKSDQTSNGVYSAPQIIVRTGEITDGMPGPDKSYGNTALFRDDKGIIWLFYNVIPFGGWSAAVVNYKVSFDNGETWSQPKRFIPYHGNLARNKPLSLGSDTFLVPLYTELFTNKGYICEIRHSEGVILSKDCRGVMDVENAIQPTLVRSGEKEIVAFLRDKKRRGVIRAVSYDSGKTWRNDGVLTLPNPNAPVDAIQLESGRTLLVYNDSSSQRTPISIAVSENRGHTFRKIKDVERGEGSYSYPAIIQTSDSLIHLVYSYRNKTIKHVIFDESWLLNQ